MEKRLTKRGWKRLRKDALKAFDEHHAAIRTPAEIELDELRDARARGLTFEEHERERGTNLECALAPSGCGTFGG